ncbi:MAG TPA: HAMP domain-containing sensor histidine kinase [Puia sp.]|nr:HAMP domain-containing sensor histidine kinase [Puia sp.]
MMILNDRAKPFGTTPDWQGKFQTAGSVFTNVYQRIKSIGFTNHMDDYEKRKLGIFNQLNFFQLLTGAIIPIAGILSNRQFHLSAWIVACMPAVISVLVLALNARREYYLAQIAYFVVNPIAISFVYFWGFNMGVELSFILYGILSVFFIQDQSQMLFALALSMASYFGLAVVCRNYTYQLATVSPFLFLINQLLAIGFIFVGLFLIKRENAGYQQSILKQKEEIAANEKLLQRQTDELTQINAFKNRLFSIIAHDLKSPIYALRNLFRNMQQLDMPAGEIKEMVPDVVNELTHTTSLMENVLHWARSQMQAYTVKPQPIDIGDLIWEVARLLRLQADAKHIGVSVAAGDSLFAIGDRDMVHLVLRNLLSNAIKYTPDNGCIELGARRQDGAVSLYVKDSGMGIPPDALEKIQENNFYTTKGTAGEAGTGLGLMLCKEFIQRNGGTLRIDSTTGKGSTFTFTLPIAS